MVGGEKKANMNAVRKSRSRRGGLWRYARSARSQCPNQRTNGEPQPSSSEERIEPPRTSIWNGRRHFDRRREAVNERRELRLPGFNFSIQASQSRLPFVDLWKDNPKLRSSCVPPSKKTKQQQPKSTFSSKPPRNGTACSR